MKVFNHHVYEYKKGLRSLILHTTCFESYDTICHKLEKSKIAYQVYKINNNKINVFFGDKNCIEIVKKINKTLLNTYTPEEDFILGIMLGYCRKQQCARYLKLFPSIQPKKIKTNQKCITKAEETDRKIC
jgi:hypothetical protein